MFFEKACARAGEFFFIEIFLFSLKHTFSMANHILKKHDSNTRDANLANLTHSHSTDQGANNRQIP